MQESSFILPIFIIALLVIGIAFITKQYDKIVIYEYQKGLLYKNGKFEKLLGAGAYNLWRANSRVEIIDTRRTIIFVPAQEIMTKDKLSVKLSAIGFYTIADPLLATNSSLGFVSDIYNQIQNALRDLVLTFTLDEILERKSELDLKLFEKAKPIGLASGIEISELQIRDITLPANLKRAYSALIEAQKDAQRQIEIARGEQAVLRNLNNSAALFDKNPMLLNARLIQALSNGQNTIVFNQDGASICPTKAKS